MAQETFLRAWKQARSWKPGGAKFDTWLHRVALNLCYDRLRKRRETPTDQPPEQVDTGPAPDAGLLGATSRGGSSRPWAALAAAPARGDRALPSPGLGQYRSRRLMEISVEALGELAFTRGVGVEGRVWTIWRARRDGGDGPKGGVVMMSLERFEDLAETYGGEFARLARGRARGRARPVGRRSGPADAGAGRRGPS